MAKKLVVEAEKIDPTLPFTEVEILGEKFKLCFTYRAITKAEARLRAQGVVSNLLENMPKLTFQNIPVILAAALGTYHPALTFEDVVDMLDYDTVFALRDEIYAAWAAALPKRDPKAPKENPPEPVQS